MPQPDPDIAEGTRKLFIGGGIAAAILFLAVIAWPLVTRNPLGTPAGGVNPAKTSQRTGEVPAQTAAESTVGKNDPAGQEDSTGGRARDIKQTSQPLQLNTEQQQKLRDIISHQANAPQLPEVDFDLMIGTSVPRQVQLQDLPPEITQVMNGYWGDQFLMVRDKMVIVDQHSRRIVAIVPNLV